MTRWLIAGGLFFLFMVTMFFWTCMRVAADADRRWDDINRQGSEG